MMIATCPRACERATAVRTCEAFDISGPSRGDPAIEPPISPVYQPKAVHFAVIAWSFDQPLATPTLRAPNACEGRVKGELHLILEIKVGSR